MDRPRRSLLAFALCGSLFVASLGTSPAAAKGPWRLKKGCTDRVLDAQPMSLPVEGEDATGHYALPATEPTTLLVFAHGYGHTSLSWAQRMEEAANEHGAAAVTMDYRGLQISPDANNDGLPESSGWPAMAGAEDLIAAAQYFEAECATIDQIVLMGVSMGGNMSGLAVALAGAGGLVRTDGTPLFDYWIDIEGAVNLTETYLEARAISPANAYAARVIEDLHAETGGPIEDNPEAYQERTVVSRIDDIRAAGLDGAVVIHGVDDGLVPYNQGREMATLLGAAQIPTDMITIGRKSPESERETTLSGYAFSQVDPNYRSPFAGHASEKSQTHIVMVTAFDRLWSLVEEGNKPGPYTETFVDGELGSVRIGT